MRKLILILFILLSCASLANSGGIMSFPGGGVPAGGSPCATEYASADLSWDGEHTTASDYACNAAGTGVDATDVVAGVIDAAGAIGGSNFGALLNAADEHVRWPATSTTIDSQGTIVCRVTLPAETTGNTSIAEIYYNTANKINLWFYNDGSDMALYHKGTNLVMSTVDLLSTNLTDGATYWIFASWDVTPSDTAGKFCTTWDAACKAAAWNVRSTAPNGTAFSTDPASYAVGDDQTGLYSISDSWKVDPCYFVEGYQWDND